MNKLKIRRLTKNDLDNFFTLRLEALKDSPLSFLPTFEEDYANGYKFYERILSLRGDDNVIFGGFVDNTLIATLAVYQGVHAKVKHKCTIWAVYVSSRFRGNGYAKALMQETIQHVKTKIGCKIINLSTGADNIPAKKLYQSFGFKTWGIEPNAFSLDEKLFDEEHMYLLIE